MSSKPRRDIGATLGRTAGQIARFLANLPTTFERLDLRILGAAGGPEVLRELEVRDLASKSHEDVAQTLHAAAEQQAEVMGREARAEIVAYRQDKRISSHIFKVGIPTDDDRLDGTPEAIIAQLQRHNEALMRMAITERGALANAYTTMLQLQSDRIKGLETENSKLRGKTKDEDMLALGIAELEADDRRSERLNQLVHAIFGEKAGKAAEILTSEKTTTKDGTDSGPPT